MIPRKKLVAALTLAAVAWLALPAVSAEEVADPTEARLFHVRFKPLSEAAELVGSILSPDGEITLQPKFKRLVVRDRVSVLDQVAPLLESFDLPPRVVDVSVSLALGSQAEAGRSRLDQLHPQDRGVFEIAPITGFTAFDPLGKRTIIGEEGAAVSTELSEDYRVDFEVDWVEDDRVKFKRFTVRRVVRSPEGEETLRTLYSAEIVIKSGQPLLLGAAQAPNSKKALFVSLQVDPR